jgi:hypothetical protein
MNGAIIIRCLEATCVWEWLSYPLVKDVKSKHGHDEYGMLLVCASTYMIKLVCIVGAC